MTETRSCQMAWQTRSVLMKLFVCCCKIFLEDVLSHLHFCHSVIFMLHAHSSHYVFNVNCQKLQHPRCEDRSNSLLTSNHDLFQAARNRFPLSHDGCSRRNQQQPDKGSTEHRSWPRLRTMRQSCLAFMHCLQGLPYRGTERTWCYPLLQQGLPKATLDQTQT